MSTPGSPSQNFVSIKEIRDGVVVLKTGELRAVLLATALNLGLKSVEEQQATIFQFGNFLNSLEFNLQITVASRRLDIRPYLLSLEERVEKIPEELLRIQTREYIEFIRSFNEDYNIMTKFFYVIVPFSSGPSGPSKKGFFSGLFGSGGKTKESADQQKFEEKRSQLEQRLGIVTQGLASMGIQSKQLNTEQLIEMYHGFMNPGELHAAVKET